MTTHARATTAPPARWAHQDDFVYWPAPRAGLNWPYARKVLLDLAALSAVGVSALFWVCLLLAVLR
jgi:hypothetical protein